MLKNKENRLRIVITSYEKIREKQNVRDFVKDEVNMKKCT